MSIKVDIFKESSPFLSARVILTFLQYVLVQLYVLRTSDLYNQLGLEIPKPTTYTIYNALIKKVGENGLMVLRKGSDAES
jgi:hypothetical protein